MTEAGRGAALALALAASPVAADEALDEERLRCLSALSSDARGGLAACERIVAGLEAVRATPGIEPWRADHASVAIGASRHAMAEALEGDAPAASCAQADAAATAFAAVVDLDAMHPETADWVRWRAGLVADMVAACREAGRGEADGPSR